jgi:hypothetical protein
MLRNSFRPLLVAAMVAMGAPAMAQDLEPEQYQPATEPTLAADPHPSPREIVQLKAMARAEQRALRISAQEWYGVRNSRMWMSPTPFTSSDPLRYDRPYQRPYAAYESLQRPFTMRVAGDGLAQSNAVEWPVRRGVAWRGVGR